MNLENRVKCQIELIENGRPLEAFSKFFSYKAVMRINNVVFANSKKKGIELQSDFFNYCY